MPTFRGKVHGELEIAHMWHADLDRTEPEYTLRGGPIVYVPMEGLRYVDIRDVFARPFTAGAYRLYPVGQDFARDAVIAAVLDGSFWWLAVLRYRLQTIGPRLLATAHIWGLADWPLGETPTWRNVYILRRIARIMEP